MKTGEMGRTRENVNPRRQGERLRKMNRDRVDEADGRG